MTHYCRFHRRLSSQVNVISSRIASFVTRSGFVRAPLLIRGGAKKKAAATDSEGLLKRKQKKSSSDKKSAKKNIVEAEAVTVR
jgi:hypothetical protein